MLSCFMERSLWSDPLIATFCLFYDSKFACILLKIYFIPFCIFVTTHILLQHIFHKFLDPSSHFTWKMVSDIHDSLTGFG